MEKLPLRYTQEEVEKMEIILSYAECILSKKDKFMRYILKGMEKIWDTPKNYLYPSKVEIKVNREIFERTQRERKSLEELIKTTIGFPKNHKGLWELEIPKNIDKIILTLAETNYINFVNVRKEKIEEVFETIKKRNKMLEQEIVKEIFKRINGKVPITTILRYFKPNKGILSVRMDISKELILIYEENKPGTIFI